MLDRNRRIKPKPEKFQLNKSKFNLIITCEERVYDQALDCKDLFCIHAVSYKNFFFYFTTESVVLL